MTDVRAAAEPQEGEPSTDPLDKLHEFIEHHAEAECYRYPDCENATTEARIALAEARASVPAAEPAATEALRPIVKALTYPCREPIHREAARALAALAASPQSPEPTAAPLDVERLARAIETAGYGEVTGDLDQYQEWGGSPREIAAKIEAAYGGNR